MAPPASSIITRVAYGISQLPRVAWYLGHGLALRRLAEAARRSNGAKARRRVRTSAPVPNRSRLYVTRLFLQGLANVEAAFIPFPPIMTDRCSRSLIDPRLFFEDLPEIHRRRERQRHNEVFNKDTRDTRPPFREPTISPLATALAAESASKLPRLIAREYCGGRSPAVLVFEINVTQRPSIAVPHDKTCNHFFDGPRGGICYGRSSQQLRRADGSRVLPAREVMRLFMDIPELGANRSSSAKARRRWLRVSRFFGMGPSTASIPRCRLGPHGLSAAWAKRRPWHRAAMSRHPHLFAQSKRTWPPGGTSALGWPRPSPTLR